ncbi:unnamed protein product [Cuscuta epithymum]|uniref:Ubiquitin-like protease family profile domain-containing protein n=1 Tax=Cuscuta epithymum TaxID=186058 RepID=A0AAV0FNF5_9ASTE|nr:unnamed protein product [Cuscuta epithymum]
MERGLSCPRIKKNSIVKKFFKGRTEITYQQLKNRMEEYKAPSKGDPLPGVKLASLYYTQCVLLSRDKRTKISPDFFKWIDDFESFKKYPWALESYNATVNHMKSLMVGQPKFFQDSKKDDPTYDKMRNTMYGFPHVLQVWAYENIPDLGKLAATKVGEEGCGLLNWKAERYFHAAKLQEKVFFEESVPADEDGDDSVLGHSIVVEELKKLRTCIESLDSRLKVVEDNVAEMKALVVARFGKSDENAAANPLSGEEEVVAEGRPPVHEGGCHTRVNHIVVEDEVVAQGSPPLDEGPSHTSLNPLSGEDEAVPEGSPSFDQGQSHTSVNPLSGEDEPVAKGNPPIDQAASQTCVTPLCGEDEAVGEGTHPLDHVPSYTGVNSLSQECHTPTNLMLCSSELGADKLHEISAKAPFENLDWADIDEDGGSAAIDVLVLEDQCRKAKLKGRKRKCSKYHCSPFTDPTRKRAKVQNKNRSPTFVDIRDDEWLELKKWVEEDDNLEPTVVVLAITGYNKVSRKFVRELIEPEEWLSSEHIDALCSLIQKSMVNKKIGLIGPYFTYTILNKDINVPKHWAEDRLLPRVNWSSFEKVLIPLNVDGLHWILTEVDLKAKVVRVYDSLRSAKSKSTAHHLCIRLPYLLNVIKCPESAAVSDDFKPWPAQVVPDVPQQRGSSECGVMMMAFAEHLALEYPLTPGCDYDNMLDMRSQFAVRLWRLKKTDV